MADIQFHFFGSGLMWSIVLSIVLSVVLTVCLNLFGRRIAKSPEDIECEYEKEVEKEAEKEEELNFEKPRAKSSGMILIGPIPIIFGSGGMRFDKKMFKYALLFFLIGLFMYFILMKTIRL